MVKLNFKINKIQFALFPKNFDISDKLKIASELKQKTGNVFQEDPAILPMPDNISPEIPRIIFESKDKSFSCNISISRIDFFGNFHEHEFKEDKSFLDDYFKKNKIIYSYFIENLKLNIKRIGLVFDFIVELDQSSLKLIKNNLLNKNSYFGKSQNLTAINLISTESGNINEWNINKRITIESLRKKSDLKNDEAIFLRYDINTLSEEDYNLKVIDIEKILRNASNIINEKKIKEFLVNENKE